MLWRIVAAFCRIDSALEAMGHKDDSQAKTPASAPLTVMELGGQHNQALALVKDLNLLTHVLPRSRFHCRPHALYPLLKMFP